MPYPAFASELKTFSSDVLDVMPGVAQLPRPHLENILQKSFEIKKELKEILGLGDDYRREFSVKSSDGLTSSPAYQVFVSVIQHVYANKAVRGTTKFNDLQLNFMARANNFLDGKNNNLRDCIVNNRIHVGSREQRFTKWLLGWMTQEMYEAVLPRFRGTGEYEKLRGKAKESLEALVTQMVEDGQNTQRRVMITANPLDILLSSTCAGFRSCHALDGEWASGNVGYTQTPFVFMIAMLQPHPVAFPYMKISRMFGYLKMPENDRFVLARAYGTFGAAQIDQVTNEITNILKARKPDEAQEWLATKVGSGDEYDMQLIGYESRDGGEQPRPIYFDKAVSMISGVKTPKVQMLMEHFQERSGRSKTASRDVFRSLEYAMKFSKTPCTACGAIHHNGYSMICENCSRKAPRCNGGRCNHAFIHVPAKPGLSAELSGNVMCMTCFEANAFICHHCTGTFPRSSKHESFYVPDVSTKVDLGQLKNSSGGPGSGMPVKKKQAMKQIHFCATCVPKVTSECTFCEKKDLISQLRVAEDVKHAKPVSICSKCDLLKNCTDCGPEKWFARVYTELNGNGKVVAQRCTTHQTQFVSSSTPVGGPAVAQKA